LSLHGAVLTQSLVLRACPKPDDASPDGESAASEPEPDAAPTLLWLRAAQPAPCLKPARRSVAHPPLLWLLGLRHESDVETYEWVTEHDAELAGEDPPSPEEDAPPQ
jgi:hypothetical protein